jgi:drug/metabolite transporter (DMT)-like permease
LIGRDDIAGPDHKARKMSEWSHPGQLSVAIDAQLKTKPDSEGQNHRPPSQYFLLLSIACLMFGSQGIFIKYLAQQLRPIQLTFLPFYTSTLLLVPLLILHRRRNGATPLTLADWRAFLVAGVAGQLVTQLCTVWGITLSLVSNAAIIGLLFPIVSSVLGARMLKERLMGLHIVTLAVGLAGASLLSLQSLRESSLTNSHYLIGNLLILVGLIASAYYNAYCKSLFSRFAQIEVLVISYITGSLASIPLVIWVDPVHMNVLRAFTPLSWLAYGYQTLITYGAAMLIFFVPLKRLPMTTVSVLLYLIPLFAVVLGVSVLGERLSSWALCGAGLILISNLVFVRRAAIVGSKPSEGS